MPGWSKEKRIIVEEGFYAYLSRAKLFSKDFSGEIILGDHLYEGQKRFITEVFDALENDIHKIFVLKSRQLGLSTIARALTSFLLGFHPGLKGACVFDTSENRQESRAELTAMINALPRSLKFPHISSDNRSGLQLANNSKILFLSAGVKKTKTSGTLGRSLGVSLAHLSELCSYDNDEGLEAFENSLSDANPDRLYIYESTARGFNSWNQMWENARKDPTHCRCIFLGWWSKPSQSISKDSSDYELYGLYPPSDKEQAKIQAVKEKYGYSVSPEQLAWVRRKMNPAAASDDSGDAQPEFEGSNTRIQEQPWTEDEAFQQTGATFFSPEVLTDQTNKFVNNKFKNYWFMTGDEFVNMRAYKARTIKESELKVWEEPEVGGNYVVGVDPAFGENEKNDRSSIQIMRCYADGVDQVAEYSSPLITTRHLAWVLSALMGWYGEGTNEVRYIMELNGPGNAVFNALKDLQVYLRIGHQMQEVQEKGLVNIFRNVQTYIYTRSDSMSAGHNYHWICLALDTKLPTPDGWTTMEKIKRGDRLFDINGVPCQVLGVSPIHINRACYRVHFDDGSSIVADENHLWGVVSRPFCNKDEIVRTKDIEVGKHNIFVAKPLLIGEVELPIDPYVLGVWLGDGAASGAHFYADPADLKAMNSNIAACGYLLGHLAIDKGLCRQTISGLRKQLSENGLLNNKHVPKIYLRAATEQRLALLQGLMDTDGNAGGTEHSRQCGFTTSSPRLRDDIIELLRSLGFKAKYCVRENRLVKVVGRKTYVAQPVYQFWFTAHPDVAVFRMPRKQNKVLSSKTGNPSRRMHRIVKVESVPSVPVKCLEIDSPTKLFLAGEGMVPTHNTNSSRKVMIMEALRDYVSNGTFRIRSAELIKEMNSISRDGDTIAAPGSKKDDKVVAAAMSVQCWLERIKTGLMASKRTRDAEAAKKMMSIKDQVQLFNQNHLEMFFSNKRVERYRTQALTRKAAWRYR